MIQLLQIKKLYKVFNKGTVNENILFNGISLNIEDNDFITVIGSNGAGKSTLLNIISGSVKSDSGSIILGDMDITKLPEYKRARFIGRVFQNPSMGTSPSMTILENLSMAANKGQRFGLKSGVLKDKISYFTDCLSHLSLGLEDKLNTKVGLLSGGQRQALSMLMAVMGNPEILLLDEHTAALDPKTSNRIMELTDEIVREKKITTIMITHNLKQAIEYGNRILMLDGGNVIIDIKGEEKKKLTKEKLLTLFNSLNDDAVGDRMLFA